MITHNSHLEIVVRDYQKALGDDLYGYKNHCYRILNYMEMMGMSDEEYHSASVLVPFHDLGVWTIDSMDYLDESANLALGYIESEGLKIPENQAREVIADHHKISRTPNDLAEKLRKADLIDLSMGFFRMGLTKNKIDRTVKIFAYHKFPQKVIGKALRHAVRHPLKPFPMLRW